MKRVGAGVDGRRGERRWIEVGSNGATASASRPAPTRAHARYTPPRSRSRSRGTRGHPDRDLAAIGDQESSTDPRRGSAARGRPRRPPGPRRRRARRAIRSGRSASISPAVARGTSRLQAALRRDPRRGARRTVSPPRRRARRRGDDPCTSPIRCASSASKRRPVVNSARVCAGADRPQDVGRDRRWDRPSRTSANANVARVRRDRDVGARDQSRAAAERRRRAPARRPASGSASIASKASGHPLGVRDVLVPREVARWRASSPCRRPRRTRPRPRQHHDTHDRPGRAPANASASSVDHRGSKRVPPLGPVEGHGRDRPVAERRPASLTSGTPRSALGRSARATPREPEREHPPRVERVDDAVVPQPRGRVVRAALALVAFADRRLERLPLAVGSPELARGRSRARFAACSPPITEMRAFGHIHRGAGSTRARTSRSCRRRTSRR